MDDDFGVRRRLQRLQEARATRESSAADEFDCIVDFTTSVHKGDRINRRAVCLGPSMASTTTTPASRRPSGVRTDRDRLRDYYGLGAGSSSGTTDTSAIPADAKKAEGSTTQNTPAATRAEDLKEVLRNESVQGLLKKHSDLQTEIRELDGERQSLVYNHHTDLVAASETIRKVSRRAHAHRFHHADDCIKPGIDR